ncbi:MAG: helix-turn-helix transcriptional regulator [Sporolactobacillus sp.]
MENIIGKRITQLREEKGWTKTFTAEKLGIKTMSTYANWEYGTRTPDGEMLTKIADLFDVSTDYLLGRTDIHNSERKKENRFFYDLDHASKEEINELENYFRYMRSKRKRMEDESK